MTVIDPRSGARWSSETMGKSTAFRSDRLMVGINAFEPGQAQRSHAHDGQDKLSVVVEGRGTFTLAGESHSLGPGEAIVAPAGVEHGVRNDGDERLLVLVTLVPPPPPKG